jgi:drug/metabolite transporter (DMT)-like permease
MLNGVALTSASAAGIILSTMPAVVAVFSAVFLRERLTGRAILAVLLAVAGIAVLQFTRAGTEPGESEHVALGNLLVFASVCCEAIYVILGKRRRRASRRAISALINLFGLC